MQRGQQGWAGYSGPVLCEQPVPRPVPVGEPRPSQKNSEVLSAASIRAAVAEYSCRKYHEPGAGQCPYSCLIHLPGRAPVQVGRLAAAARQQLAEEAERLLAA